MITRDQLQRFAPRPAKGTAASNWDVYAASLVDHAEELCAQFAIDTALEWQHFMAQIGHESGGFTVLWEDMGYRSERIMEIFGVGRHSARITEAEAHELEKKPEALAERVYGLGNPSKAKELGNVQPGDGYRYRGFGPMQVTGRKDHERLLHGDRTPYAALRAAFAEWDEKGCNELAARDDIKSITRRINGGYNGLEDRKKYLARAKRLWPQFPGDAARIVSDRQIVESSSKAQSAQAAANAAKVTIGVGTLVEAADPLAKATAHIDTVNAFTASMATFAAFAKAHTGLLLVVGAGFVLWLGRNWIRRIIIDYRSGRYVPSKGDPAEGAQS